MHNPKQRRFRFYRSLAPLMQSLEQRRMLSADGTSYPTFVIDASPSPLSPPFTPAQIRQAYGLNSISANGAGQTIAIVDAYNDPDITTDVKNFNTDYSLQQFNTGGPTFTIKTQTGGASPLPPNAAPGNWDVEESLDVEYAHTIAPDANIILFEANSDNNDDLYAAVNTARNIPAVSVITMSFGGEEDPSDTAEDSLFTTPAGHQGITFIASTGDSGEPGGYPAYSPNILAVGGTSLTINGDGSYGGETAWSDGGGGISQYESQPDYQTAKAAPFSTTQRTEPDVSWLADPNTGVNVLDTYADESSNGLIQIGGTSLATPMWGGLIAMIDQTRVANSEPTLDGPSQTLPMLYDLPANAFNDITTGNNGFAAGPGYDLATGLGTPNVPVLFSDMVGETTLYVDAGAPGTTQNGSSWNDAFTTLSQALSAATGNDEILVSQGSYTVPIGSSSATFQLADNVAIYGGYAGYGASNPNAQDPTVYATFLEGESDHLVTGSGTNSSALLDGVTIENSNSQPSGTGVAFFNSAGSPTITNTTFAHNYDVNGGALYDTADSAPLLVNCIFDDNTATSGGGAIDDTDSSAASIIHCTFTEDNTFDTGGGGAIEIQSSNTTVTDCTFNQNTAGVGGAIDVTGPSTPVITSCIFTQNSANDGGAVQVDGGANPQFINCLFVNNSSNDGVDEASDSASAAFINCTFAGGTGNDVFLLASNSTLNLTNCIVWCTFTTSISEDNSGDTTNISYSDIYGDFAGTGNINTDPQFVTAPTTSGGGRFPIVFTNGDEHLVLTSPAIDAGNNSAVPSNITTDLDGRPRFVNIPGVNDPGAIVDMGAYEAWESIVYVDSHATGSDTGGSWANAFTTLTAALGNAIAGQTIEVAQGTYYPTTTTSRSAAFQLIDNVTIEGGFAGVLSANPDTRNPALYPTILSGDIGTAGDSSDNSYHVVTGDYTNFTATLDGFTITGGNADADATTDIDDAIGGGMYIDDGSPTINDCIFTSNFSIVFGGGIFEQDNADPVISSCTFTDNVAGTSLLYNAFGGAIGNYGANPYIVDCTFTGNSAVSPDGGAYGGAIENEYSTPTIVSCTFTQNVATGGQGGLGGAVDNQDDSSPEIDDSVFDGNTTNEAGGAIMNITCIPTLNNCVFAGNAAPYGGAMYNFQSASPTIINCTFASNLAEVGGAIVNDTKSIPVITNSILWGDEALDAGNEIYLATTNAGVTITHSDIDGGYAGTGNINVDPQFLRNPDPGTDGQWGTADDYYGNLALSATSPAIDIGKNSAVHSGITTDVANQPRFVNIPGIHDPGAIVDLGAFEAQLVNATAFNFTSSSQITVQFSANVSASLTAGDLHLMPTFGSNPISASTFSYSSATNTATFGFASPLPADIYSVSLDNAAITDASGNVLSNTYQFSFLYVPANGSLSLPGAASAYTVQQLSIGSAATLDVGNDELIVQYTGATPASTIQSLITSGANGGNWNGTGIISSDISLGTSVGYFDDNSEVTIRRTWLGDANLNGVIDSDDVSLMLLGQILGQTSWQFGNFNYGTAVTSDDWSLLLLGTAVSNGQSINTLFSAFAPSASIAAKPQFVASSGADFSSTLTLSPPLPLAVMPSILDEPLT